MDYSHGDVEFSVSKIELINYYDDEAHNVHHPGAFQQKFTYYVQNSCNFSRKVRVSVNESSDPAYQLLRGAEEKYLAPGLKLPIVLKYSPADSGCHIGEITIYVDDESAALVPIKAIPPMPQLEFCPSVIDFGCLVCEHQLAYQSLTITNIGSKGGDFMFLVDQLPHIITVTPMQIKLPPGQSVDIKVELLCNEEGSFSEQLRITTDGCKETPLLIPLYAVIVSRQLEILDPSNSSCNFERVDFGNVYYNTVVSRNVLLFNNSPVSTQFLAVINSNAEGSVDGMDINAELAVVCNKQGYCQQSYKEQSNGLPGETLVQIIPMQGGLDPYEKKMINISFAPRYKKSDSGWTHHQSLPVHRDYVIFVQFIHVGMNKTDINQGSTAEIAVTGSARALQLTVKPSTTIDFSSCDMGQNRTEEILLSNESDVLPIHFQCHQVAHYKCLPSSGRIIPGQVITLMVTFQPRQLGPLNCKMQIDALWPSKEKIKEAFHRIVLDLHGDGIQHSVDMTGTKKWLAHPNDLASSVRPHDGSVALITPYTRVPRYTYVDPDYCYNFKELQDHKTHKQSYINYNREKQALREWIKKEQAYIDPASATNIPLTSGLNSPCLPLPKEISSPLPRLRDDNNTPVTKLCSGARMLTSKDVDDLTSVPLEFIESCSSKPINFKVASQCQCELTPAELSQILFEPTILDFGSIIVDCIVEKCITIKNFSNKHVSIQMKVAEARVQCKNYDENHPAFVLAPHSFTKLTLSTQQHNIGVVERCVEYSINVHHRGHIPMKACVVQLTLSLSTTQLNLSEPYLAYKAVGLRGSVVITNKHSIAAEFQWHAREEVDTNTFYMMHPSGTVPAGCNLECEFICQPSYDCPATAQFLLTVGNKDTSLANDLQRSILTLIPKFSKPLCNFREKRLLFGTVPLNLTSIRTIHIENKGKCHAYFKIRNPSPHSGMTVYCESGCVPVGGAVELKIILRPEVTGQFDVKLYIDLKEGKCCSLRIAGTVECPSVTVSKDIFRFGGVYCGASATIPFTVSNKGSARAQLQFDLSYLSDFVMIFPSKNNPHDESSYRSCGNGIYVIDLPRKSDTPCELQFCPQTVASYDYQLPVLVNGLRAPAPPPSPWPPSNTPSTITLNQGFEPSLTLTPTRRVLATVLKSPLQVFNTVLNFSLHPGFLDETMAPMKHTQVIKLRNISEDPLSWNLDSSNVRRLDDKTFQFCPQSGVNETDQFLLPKSTSAAHLQPGEEFVFTALFCPPHHGTFSASIPLILNGDVSKPYRKIELKGTLPARRISVDPKHILVQPVPLGVSVTMQFTVFVEYFMSPVELQASLPRCQDHVYLAVRFPAGSTAANTCCSKIGISCELEFCSSQPIFKSDYIIISDKTSTLRKRIPFTVVADNSLFTMYTFQTQHFNSASIKQNNDNFHNRLSELRYTCKKDKEPESNLSLTSGSILDIKGYNTAATFMFPDTFIEDCVLAVCRWLSVYGWSNGVKSLSTPLDLRVRVGEDLPKLGVKERSIVGTSRGLLIDMLTNLCGRVPPGTPLNLPPCTTAMEKVNQQYSSYDSVISFLRNQGGYLWCVVPESLLDYQDFRQWILCEDTETIRNTSFNPQSQEEFDDLSKQAWTHLVMQIIKVLVLPRVINHVPEFLKEDVDSIEPLDNNMYSKPERVLLAWLNFHYKKQCEKLRRRPGSGTQQIINFDVDLMDSIVLACVLISYCPFLLETHFEQFYTHPSTPEQCSHNAVLFVSALKYIGIDYDIQPSDLCSSNPITMVLFVMHLYERMFAFKPKKTLIFETVLGECVIQQLQVENTTMKQMEYHILIRGEDAEDFNLLNSSATVMLAGDQSNQLTLSFHGHFLNPSSAILLIVARGNIASAATSVQAFRLRGYVTKAKPWISSKSSAPLYDVQALSLAVSSPFVKSGLFEISLSESSDKGLLSSVSCSDSDSKSRGKVVMIPASSLQKRSDDQIQMFHLADQSQIHLEPGYTAVLTLKFVPLKLRARHCAVILRNKQLGDVVLSVYATVKYPRPIIPESICLNSSTMVNTQTRTLHLKAHAGETIDEEIFIYSNNVAFENAMLEISKWDMSHLEIKRRILSESFKSAILSTAAATFGLDDEPNTRKEQPLEESERIVFSVEGSNKKHFSHPKEVSLMANSGGIVLPIKFLAESEGQYECCLILKSLHDIRVVIIESTVLATGRHAQLEFKTKAMVPLTQDIPLVNPSTVDWPLVATLNGTGFSGPEFVVAKGLATTSYPLTFSPKREGIIKGDLHLVNNSDKSEYVFELLGVADRPIAQDHIRLHVQAKTSMTHILHVRNEHDRTMIFQVESDLDFISGPSTITIGGDDVVDYPLSVVPKRRGFFTGAVAFIAQAVSRPHSFSESLEVPLESSTPFHVWFHVECLVDAAPPTHTITVSSPTLSSSTVQLNVTNSLSYHLRLKVLLEGQGLSGPEHLDIKPSGVALYPLTFTPKLAGHTKGRVVFDSVRDGEFWYELDLIADNPKPTHVSPVTCEIGKTCSKTVSLTNPLDIPVRFKCNNTNTNHFIVAGLAEGQVTVEPCSSVDVHILFKPSAIGAADHATELVFTSEQFGNHIFNLKGQGVSPSTMDPITITANLKSSSMQVINFTNPLDNATHFSVSLKGQDLEHFCLLMKRTNSIMLQPGVSLDIPVMFAPEVMCSHRAELIIFAEERSKDCPLQWCYPIVGQPALRMDSSNSVLNVTCRAKERLEQTFSVSLLHSTENTHTETPASKTGSSRLSTELSFSYKLVCRDAHLCSLVEKSAGIRLLGKKIGSSDSGINEATQLDFLIVFTPPKAFRGSCDLYVTGGAGAVWIYPLCLIATPAAPDDVVVIEAAGLNKEAEVKFRLTSLTEHPVPFTARLAGDSDSEISVSPTSGELAPVSTRGTLFCITYKPTLYGRKHRAKFIVQSETNEWCYDIVGKLPTISGFSKAQAIVKHKSNPKLSDTVTRNYVHKNLRLLSIK